MSLVQSRPRILSIAEACEAVGLPRATYYYAIRGGRPRGVRRSPRRLSDRERQRVLDVLSSERFCDLSPREVWAELLDGGRYLCSVRTMYRILADNAAVRERRDHQRHPDYVRPELLATGPNQVWSWDITKLLGPAKWTYYYLYVIIDIYSRYPPGWMLAHVERAHLAARPLADTNRRQGRGPDPPPRCPAAPLPR